MIRRWWIVAVQTYFGLSRQRCSLTKRNRLNGFNARANRGLCEKGLNDRGKQERAAAGDGNGSIRGALCFLLFGVYITWWLVGYCARCAHFAILFRRSFAAHFITPRDWRIKHPAKGISTLAARATNSIPPSWLSFGFTILPVTMKCTLNSIANNSKCN